MPVFKITAMQEVRSTYIIYVDAKNERQADYFAAGISNLDDVPGAIVVDEEKMGGSIDDVEEVESALNGTPVITATWEDGVAVVLPPVD